MLETQLQQARERIDDLERRSVVAKEENIILMDRLMKSGHDSMNSSKRYNAQATALKNQLHDTQQVIPRGKAKPMYGLGHPEILIIEI